MNFNDTKAKYASIIPDAITLDVDLNFNVDVAIEIDDDEIDVLADAVDAHIRNKFDQLEAQNEQIEHDHNQHEDLNL